jgi:predicted transcriptional regulator
MTIPHVPITPIIAFDINDFTEGTISGNGAFDKTMAIAREHLKGEHDAGRITGDKFAEVYLGTMQTVLQTAMQYALSQPKIEYEVSILSRQAELLDHETENTIKQGVLLDTQELLATEQVVTQIEETASVIARTALTVEQTDILTKQKGFTTLR